MASVPNLEVLLGQVEQFYVEFCNFLVSYLCKLFKLIIKSDNGIIIKPPVSFHGGQ
jgi:hypothetical protein